MTTRVGLWQTKSKAPKRLDTANIEIEQHLEEWIECDPTLIRIGLKIVGRQFRTAAGPIDLLAIDQQGRWIVIEIKRGNVRRATITQAIDYAASLRQMDEAELCESVKSYLKNQHAGSLESLQRDHPEAFGVTDGPP